LRKKLKDLRELYINQLRTVLSAEIQITRALPTIIDRATDQQLKQAFQSHLQETEFHVSRIEDILSRAVGKSEQIKCNAVAALVAETEDLILDAKDDSVRDAALIAAGQRVEHYEIAVYGAIRHFAQILGEAEAAELLDKTIKEEGHADHLLTSIANRINPAAQQAA